MARATMRLSDGTARHRRMARIIDELFTANWIQTFEGGGINVDIAADERSRFEQFIAQFDLTIRYDYGKHYRQGRHIHDLSLK